MKRILLLILILLPGLTFSQLVNIEKKRKGKKDGFQGYIDFSINVTENTKKIIQWKNNVNLQYSKGASTFLFFNDISLMNVTSGGEKSDLINQNFQHLRYNYTIKDSSFITWEVFAQRQQNKVKFLDFRFISGTGPRFRLVDNNRMGIYIAPLFMYEYEDEKESDEVIVNKQVIKGDFYTTFWFNFDDKVTFSNVTYYQPALFDLQNRSDFEVFFDYRIASESSLTFSIIKDRLDFSVVYEMSYDSKPPYQYKSDYDINRMFFYSIKNKLRILL